MQARLTIIQLSRTRTGRGASRERVESLEVPRGCVSRGNEGQSWSIGVTS
jgi:hypothetical protein